MTCEIHQLEQTSQIFPLCNFTDSSGSMPGIDLFWYSQKKHAQYTSQATVGSASPSTPNSRFSSLQASSQLYFCSYSIIIPPPFVFHHYSSFSSSQTSQYNAMLLSLEVQSLSTPSSSLNSPFSVIPSHVLHLFTPTLLSNIYTQLRKWERP